MNFNNQPLRTGDFITTTASHNLFLTHKAIIVVEDDGMPWVLHNSPDNINECGGNVGYEPLSDFIAQGRKILAVEHTAMDKAHILCMGESVAHQKFHITKFNCEQFAYYVRDCEPSSPQLDKWVMVSLCGMLLL